MILNKELKKEKKQSYLDYYFTRIDMILYYNLFAVFLASAMCIYIVAKIIDSIFFNQCSLKKIFYV